MKFARLPPPARTFPKFLGCFWDPLPARAFTRMQLMLDIRSISENENEKITQGFAGAVKSNESVD